ncbi:ABC transporter ATP-binding protein [Cryptosporangium minutisporangium]|uniref:ATP-binding cassette domain-containing protein n=1 Tax=Cryptosporangium minutisporangium TaxID=113569 RepID=A0ABP6SV75_9ACTN
MLTVRGLRKDYPGPVTAVRNLDLDVGAGEIVGLLGPNGAGKTTTMRMLTTLLRPTSGTATIAGVDLVTDPAGVRRRIGTVGQGGSTDPTFTIREELELQGRLHGLSAATARARADELIERFDLGSSDGGDRPTGRLSGGQRRRLDVALGLVHRPTVLFLDEPSTGLDPRSRATLWDSVRAVRDEGTTVVLTTHYLAEADACCDRVVVIDAGRVVADGTPAALKSEAGANSTLDDVFLALTNRTEELA